MSARLEKYQLQEAWANLEKSDDISCEKKKNVKTKNKRISQKTKNNNNKKQKKTTTKEKKKKKKLHLYWLFV